MRNARILLLLCLLLITLTITVVASAQGGRAQVHDVPCAIWLEPIGGSGAISTTGHVIVTYPFDNANLKCSGDIPEHLVPDKTIIAKRFVYQICAPEPVIGCEWTDRTRIVYTPGGKAHFTAHYNFGHWN